MGVGALVYIKFGCFLETLPCFPLCLLKKLYNPILPYFKGMNVFKIKIQNLIFEDQYI